MSMASDSSNLRRAPQLERGERRVAQLLRTAAEVLAEVGYDAATMTEIASRAGASIGTVYQYFPNKEALVLALRQQYVEEMEVRWSDFDVLTAQMSIREIAHLLMDLAAGFVDSRPAYYAVVDAPGVFKRSPEARQRLRQKVAKAFREKRSSLSQAEAYRIANVALQIVKSMHPLYAEASAQEREALVKEYKQVLAAYLESRLKS